MSNAVLVDALRRDVRHALRALRAQPAHSFLAVAMLAFGIGLSTALMSMADAVLVRPLPFAEPGRLVEISGADSRRGGMRVPRELYAALVAGARSLEAIAIHNPVAAVLRTSEGNEDVRGERVSTNYLAVLGVQPALGRPFAPSDDDAPVAVVSHDFWRRFLGADPGAIGRTVVLDSTTYTVIGVMPAFFRTSFRGTAGPSYWTPRAPKPVQALERRSGYELIGRIVRAANVEQARLEAERIGRSSGLDGWDARGRRLTVISLSQDIIRDSALGLQFVLAGVMLLLLIVCANLAMFMLARAERRLVEFATRKALGASAGRIAWLALAESICLALAGGIGGVALAYALLPMLIALAPSEIPRIAEARIDLRVIGAGVGLVCITAVAIGLLPALRLSRLPTMAALRRVTTAPRQGAVRSGFVLVQVAASAALCILAGLFDRSFLALAPSEPGFRTESLSAYWILPRPSLYPDSMQQLRRAAQVADAIRNVAGVSDVALASNIPFSGDAGSARIRDAADSAIALANVDSRIISPNYFAVLGISLLRGRMFTSLDAQGAPGVAIVNAALAKNLAADGSVIGRRIVAGGDSRVWEIVGVAADTRARGSVTEPLREIYFPASQRASDFTYLLIRSTAPAGELAPAVRRAVRSAAPEIPLGDRNTLVPLDVLVQRAFAAPRFLAVLSSTFGIASMALALLGVVGLVTFIVVQRSHEFAVRTALGATPGDLARLAGGQAVYLLAAGLALGLILAVYGSRFVRSALHQAAAVEPGVIVLTAAALFVAGLVATAFAILPAMRADPMRALKAP